MSLLEVAKIAGVSTSTVSRVINGFPRVAPETAETVRRTIKQINFVPRRHRKGRANGSKTKRVAMIVLEGTDCGTSPAFQHFLKGVSAAAGQNDVDFTVGFLESDGSLPRDLSDKHLDGVLLHGRLPGAAVHDRLAGIPSVWLMAEGQRPDWGDQVMADNARVGELAASYLRGRGHKNVAFLGLRSRHWTLDIRGLAFSGTAENHGARVSRLLLPTPSDFRQGTRVAEAARTLVQGILNEGPGPIGLFVADDRLSPAWGRELAKAGHSLGLDLDVISCNDESAYLDQVGPPLPSIDIRTEAIGFRGLEQLCWRMRNPQTAERVRVLVEPCLTNMVERG